MRRKYKIKYTIENDIVKERIYYNNHVNLLSLNPIEGYDFLGWAENKNENDLDNIYINSKGLNVKKLRKLILFPIYKQIYYIVNYSKYSVDAYGTMINEKVAHGTKYILKSNKYIRPNYQFIGWSDDYENRSTKYKDNEEITIIYNIDLYAVWCSYIVKFHPNGGVPNNILYGYYIKGEKKPLINCSFTKHNNKFLGWSLSKNNDKADYKNGELVNDLTNDLYINLYAIWEKPKFNIVFNSNKGQGIMQNQVSDTQRVTLNTNNFFRKGCTFVGWNKDVNSSKALYFDNANIQFKMEEPIITLYAVWKVVYDESYFGTGSLSKDKKLKKLNDEYITYNSLKNTKDLNKRNEAEMIIASLKVLILQIQEGI